MFRCEPCSEFSSSFSAPSLGCSAAVVASYSKILSCDNSSRCSSVGIPDQDSICSTDCSGLPRGRSGPTGSCFSLSSSPRLLCSGTKLDSSFIGVSFPGSVDRSADDEFRKRTSYGLPLGTIFPLGARPTFQFQAMAAGNWVIFGADRVLANHRIYRVPPSSPVGH